MVKKDTKKQAPVKTGPEKKAAPAKAKLIKKAPEPKPAERPKEPAKRSVKVPAEKPAILVQQLPFEAKQPAKAKPEVTAEHPQAPKPGFEPVQPPAPHQPEKKKIIIDTPDILVKDLADKIGVRASELIKALMLKGVMATINQRIDANAAKSAVAGYDVDVEVKIKTREEKIVKSSVIQSKSIISRHPIVTIMGHVDHGKTRLLDTIRNTNVAAKEAGGITQHIGAYEVEQKGKKITFLDTPGHEAFTMLRARGARVTDIAILVVAADDGVMPQTIEAIDHARAAGVPIIVAINKIDKPEANVDRVKKQLAQHDLTPEDWGGQTVTCLISAKQNQGIDELLEMILLVSDMLELKADPSVKATGVVVESKIDKGRGPVATVLIQNGTLKIGDPFVIGATFGKIRALVNDRGANIKSAGPAMPVEILGSSDVPQPGDQMIVVSSEREAREIVSQKIEEIKRSAGRKISLESFSKHIKEGEKRDLNLIIKADVQGSLEALNASLEKQAVEGLKVRIIHSGVGDINESDIMLAEASSAIVIGFHVNFGGSAKQLAEAEGIDVKLYNIIYNIVDDVKLALEGLLEPEYEEVSLGSAEVRAIYKYSKVGVIAGSFVLDGKLNRGCLIRIKRDGKKVYEGKLESLKRFKDDVKSVEKGFECGIAIMGYDNFKVGDIVEAYEIRVKPRKKD